MKQISLLSLLFSVLILCGAQATAKDYDWKLVKDQDGIKLYKSDSPEVEFKTYKAITEINQPMEALLEVMLDIPAYPQWMTGSREASVVKMISPDRLDGNMLLYVVWDALWPFNNRDLVMKVSTVTDWDNNRVIVWLQNAQDPLVPLKDGLVRIAYFSAQFEFAYIDRENTRVSYMNTIDPGGVVTPGVATIQTANVPFNTLKGLAKQAQDPKYLQLAKEDFF